MRVATLFSGAGGADLGLTRAGWEIVFANDINDHACDTYELNHGPIDRRSVDLVTGMDIPYADLLWASCPCQPWSLENNNRLGARDDRNKFPAYLRLLAEKLPPATAFENVPRLTSDSYFKTIVRRMRNLGYGVAAQVVNAVHLGVPQSRERLICIGIMGGSDDDAKRAFPKKIGPRRSVGDVCPDIAYVEGYKRCVHIYQAACLPMRTITASDSGLKARLHDGTLRKFTIEELLTLSSFPLDFKWPVGSSYSEQHARIGNAVPPLMMFHIASAIRDALQRSR